MAMISDPVMALDQSACRQARLARDPRFDGLFFVGVKTTGIFCRPICPAVAPKESNVHYYTSALSARQAGLRPCLRCRPEAAPGSAAWRGTYTSLARAIRMIEEGEWHDQSLQEFAARLGMSDRYLRKLFQQQLGISPLKYAHFRRALFAKQLLQQTSLSVPDVAHMSGFGSTRAFNRVFYELMGMNPRTLRRHTEGSDSSDARIILFLSYRPPYNWRALRDFYQQRQITELEEVKENSYSRSFCLNKCVGVFKATHQPEQNGFRVSLTISQVDQCLAVVQRIRRLLDLDADSNAIDQHLAQHLALRSLNYKGLRLPGVWSPFESGIRGILGQQVSVKAAHSLVSRLVHELGEPLSRLRQHSNMSTVTRLFPEPKAVASAKLNFMPIPEKRRQALRLLAQHFVRSNATSPHSNSVLTSQYEDWLCIPGIGTWTVQYALFRTGYPDVYLAGDLGVKNALKKLNVDSDSKHQLVKTELSPWGSYATLILWQSLTNNSEYSYE